MPAPVAAQSQRSDPELEAFAGTIMIVAPHMDDETLACGGLMARLPDTSRVHIVLATDGMKSPAPVVPWRDSITPDLGARRRDESRRAAHMLGVPPQNLEFLCLPEAELPQHRAELARMLRESMRRVDPDVILIPFRYDRHPDHLAVNHVVVAAKAEGATRAALVEYFIYYRWRLLPRGDIRAYVRREHLIQIDIRGVASRKRAALDCFTSQTTRFYPWQTRPILRPELLDEECVGPEQFVRYDDSVAGARIFTSTVTWIRIAHRLEPVLQRWKYRVKSTLTRAAGRNA